MLERSLCSGRAGWLPQCANHGAGTHRNHRLHDGLRYTGIEPDLALVKYKKLVGGGIIKIVNNTVRKR